MLSPDQPLKTEPDFFANVEGLELALPIDSANILADLVRQSAETVQPPPDRFPDQWADAHRTLPRGGPKPGQWDSKLNAYMTPVGRAFEDPRLDTVICVMFTQGGKSATFFNVIGKRFADDPVTTMFIAPGDKLLKEKIAPKVRQMIMSTPELWEKTAKGQKFKLTHMIINGAELHMASSNSSSQISSEACGLVLMDEFDLMTADKSLGGSTWEQGEARLGGFPDGKIGAISSPTIGTVKSEMLATGLDHYMVQEPGPEEENPVQSPIWLKWQEGTRFQTACPCSQCHQYFIPYSKLLRWPKGATPAMALKMAWLECPNCRHHIGMLSKRFLIEKSMPVAPGQHLNKYDPDRPDGVGIDDEWVEFGNYKLPDNHGGIASFHINGLLSFSNRKSFNYLANRLLTAYNSGDPDKIQGRLNTDFGELFAVRGQRPEVSAVLACKDNYRRGEVPDWVSTLALGVDPSEDRLWYVLLGFGPGWRCAMIQYGQIMGETGRPLEAPQVWHELDELINAEWDGLKITCVGIDSRHHSDAVKAYCKPRYPKCRPVAGGFALTADWVENPMEKKQNGKKDKYGMHLLSFDSVGYKKWTHTRITLNADTESRQRIEDGDQEIKWRIPSDTNEDYARHLVSEALVKGRNGQRDKYEQKSVLNHWLDANSQARAALVRWLNGRPVPKPQNMKQTAKIKKPGGRRFGPGPAVSKMSDDPRI